MMLQWRLVFEAIQSFCHPFCNQNSASTPSEATSLCRQMEAFENGVLPTYEYLNTLLWASITIF